MEKKLYLLLIREIRKRINGLYCPFIEYNLVSFVTVVDLPL